MGEGKVESEKKLQNIDLKNTQYGQDGEKSVKALRENVEKLKNAENQAQKDNVSGYRKRKFILTGEETENEKNLETSKSRNDTETKELTTENDISTNQINNPQQEKTLEQVCDVATKKPKKIDRRNRPIIHNSVWLCMDQMNQEDIAGNLYKSKSKYRKWKNLDYELIEYVSRDDVTKRKVKDNIDEEDVNTDSVIDESEIKNGEEKEQIKTQGDGFIANEFGNEQTVAYKKTKQPKLTSRQEYELLSEEEKDKFILSLKRRGIILYDHMANDDTIMLTQMMVGISHPEHPEFYQQMVNKILQRCENFTDNELRLMIKYSTYNYRYYANRYAMAPEIRIGDRFFRLISPSVPLERDAREQLIEIFARLLGERVLKKDELYPVKKYFD